MVSSSPPNSAGQGLLGLAELLARRGEPNLPRAGRQPDRARPVVGDDGYAANRRQQGLPLHDQPQGRGLRDDLLVVRELPLHQLRDELEAVGPHEELVLPDREVHASAPPSTRVSSWTALRGTIPPSPRLRPRRPRERQSVAVGGHQPELLLARDEIEAVQERAALVLDIA